MLVLQVSGPSICQCVYEKVPLAGLNKLQVKAMDHGQLGRKHENFTLHEDMDAGHVPLTGHMDERFMKLGSSAGHRSPLDKTEPKKFERLDHGDNRKAGQVLLTQKTEIGELSISLKPIQYSMATDNRTEPERTMQTGLVD